MDPMTFSTELVKLTALPAGLVARANAIGENLSEEDREGLRASLSNLDLQMRELLATAMLSLEAFERTVHDAEAGMKRIVRSAEESEEQSDNLTEAERKLKSIS